MNNLPPFIIDLIEYIDNLDFINKFKNGEIDIGDEFDAAICDIKKWRTIGSNMINYIKNNNIKETGDRMEIRQTINTVIGLCLMLKYCNDENLYFEIHERIDEEITRLDSYPFNVRDKKYINHMVEIYARNGIYFIYPDVDEIDEPVTFRRYLRSDILYRIYDAILG